MNNTRPKPTGFFRVDIRPGSQAWAAGPVRTDANGVARLTHEQQSELRAMGIKFTPAPEPAPICLTDDAAQDMLLRKLRDRLSFAAVQEAAIDAERKAAAARLAAKAPDWRSILGNPQSLADAELSYREQAKSAHPDADGGSDESMRALNAAIAAARNYFT